MESYDTIWVIQYEWNFNNFQSLYKIFHEQSSAVSIYEARCIWKSLDQFSSVPQFCPALWDPMDCSMPGFPVYLQLPEFAHTHIHPVGDAIQPSHLLLSPSPPTLNLSQHQGLFQWVSSLNQVAKVLEFQLQHQFFQWIFWTDFL